MRMNLDEVQSRIAAVADQDESTANISTADYSLRTKYINMAQKEWAETYDWKVLFTEYNSLVSTSSANASIALPSNFRKLANYPQVASGGETNKYKETLPQDDSQYSESDKRAWILGSPNSGYVLRIFGTTLTSGASVKVPYFRSAVSLVTTTDVSDIPNADYLVQRSLAFIWESREDARFPQAKAEAEKILSNMLEFEQVPNSASDWDRVKSVEETRYGFRIGRD